MNLQDFKKIFTEHGGSVTPDQIEELSDIVFVLDLITEQLHLSSKE